MKLNIAILALSLGASSAFASDAARQTAAQTIPLKDGGILYMFKDGKMAKEDRYGRAQYLRSGDTLQTVDGKQITASSNEVARLNYLLKKGHGDK
ncbi:MAG: CopK family periplasmic copper-binding protein [Hydrogenophaga sp.]|jgi:hypothetical protein|uniref:CopK family periplasmic copper-binding protein n=1 Tax=Hydrogenophaga sp. TaxID=1904254 RepID=UPI0016A6B31F|nr:CopK family periplasmic copper-binding protein [Hydrogenophaga sp.]NIU63239.1 CopK family periplasmic copper-binding protein [Stutzerimonas stutzeri]NIV38527.1 CopK family periplasmic copper-binding protein [Anaerolineae bacterium]MBN9373600.1 CopK family periplasmic copper-binding protein [Hydrogenophaga sp.]NIM42340.1 CopK family periplasmic copper-binding protein [Hydrogenophaga sp.]NIN27495.1 CopK family periplasmic copper-binding protein [Hydrogenophaga sp.]